MNYGVFGYAFNAQMYYEIKIKYCNKFTRETINKLNFSL